MPVSALTIQHLGIPTWTLVGKIPFVLFIGLVFWAGRNKGWDARRNVLATAAFVTGLCLGTAFLPSVLGAMGGGIILWLAAQRVLGLASPPLAAMGLGLMALVGVGRFGCLLAGCCHGTLTDVPWAVTYAAGSHAHFLHQSLGLIAPNAAHSLPVHPYPLYESVGLLLALPVLARLARRLRSEGAVLALCGATDLALRGFIDGYRAMVNVWWAPLYSWLGLNVFQWLLFAAALALLELAICLERRVRQLAPLPIRTQAASRVGSRPALPAADHRGRVWEPGAGSHVSMWLVYLGLCALGLCTNREQTSFLHHALVVALALCVPALPAPKFVAQRVRTLVGYAAAGVALVLVGLHLESGAFADDARSTAGDVPDRTWRYDVDQNRGISVRVGNGATPADDIAHREAVLSLPPLAAPVHRSRTWVGVGMSGGSGSYSETITVQTNNGGEQSCGGNTTTFTNTYARKSWAGYAQVERGIANQDSILWLGGRAGAAHERMTGATYDGDIDKEVDVGYAQGWVELEKLSCAFGAGLHLRRTSNGDISVLPTGHARMGFRYVGLDVGYMDRASYLGEHSGRFGLSFAIPKGTANFNHPDDVAARLFVGAQFFPGTLRADTRIIPSLGVETILANRFALGFDVGARDDLVFGGAHLRTAFGP